MDLASELGRLERDLRNGHVPEDIIDLLCVSVKYPEYAEKTSWCAAKIGQNKIKDKEAYDLLLSMDVSDPEVKENIAWGIGEFAGCGISSEKGLLIICGLLSDDETTVRGMAAWAAGRLISRMGLKDDAMIRKLIALKEDASQFVRDAAIYATEGI